MSKKSIFILELLICLLAFISCGTNKEFVYQYQPPTIEEEIIDEHLTNNNIEALIEDCLKYPDYNNQISNYLLYDIDYSDTDYPQLLQYQQIAKHDSILFSGYEFHIAQKEEKILSTTSYAQLVEYQQFAIRDSILHKRYEALKNRKEGRILSIVSEMSLEEISRYYKNNVSEQSFLRPVLCSAFTRIIDTLQYTEIKTIYNTFSSTDIGDSIAPYYIEAREAIKPQITKGYKNYCAIEKEIRDYYLEKTKEELDLYIANSIEAFIEDLFDKDLPRRKEKVENKYNMSFNKNISKYQMSYIVNSNIKELVSVINSGRNSFLEELTETTIESTMLYTPQDDNYIKSEYTKSPDIVDLYKISEIQNRVDLKGIVLGAASLFTGGWAGLALSVLDIRHSVKNVKGKAAESMPYIRSFVTKTQEYLEDMSNYYISIGFDSFDSENAATSKTFKEIVYEVY